MLKIVKNPRFLFPLFMASTMGFIMSGTMTFIHLGLSPNFLSLWMHSFIAAFFVAFPTIFLVAPLVQKLVRKICE